MKRKTKRAVLFLALAILAGAWLLTVYMAELDVKAAAEPVGAEATGYDLSIGTQKDMTALSWAWNGSTVNLTRDAQGRWQNADDADCPIDNAKAGTLARAAAAISASMAIEGVTDFAQYGLDDPALVVMAAAGDAIVSYEIGNLAITGEYYMRVDRGSTVYMESGGLASAFRVGLSSLLATESLPEDIGEVNGISVQTDAQSYELRFFDDDGTWRRTDGAEMHSVEEGSVRSLYELVLAADLSECVGWDAGAGYGFEHPQGAVTLFYTDEDGADAAFTLEFGDYDGREVYVRFAGSGLVYRVSAAALDALMYPDWDSMLPLTVLDIDLDGITALTIGQDGVEYEVIRLRETEDAEVIYSMNGWMLDAKRMDAWLSELRALTAEGTSPAEAGRAELFSLIITGKAEDEPEEVSLSVWQYDSAHALCVTDGRSLLIPKEKGASLSDELDAILTAE